MATDYGDYNPTDLDALANGAFHDASLRGYRKVIDLADGSGGTANVLHIARLRDGSVPRRITLFCSTNASGINFTAGTAADPDAYAPAIAGPNATEITFVLNAATRAMDPLDTTTDVVVAPSGNMPATGTVVAWVEASHR